MTQPLLTAHNLVKSYGTTQALAGVSLSIGAGESVAIMGASGSGKTTLLHTLAGIITPDGGSVTFEGPSQPIEVSALSETDRSRLRRESFGFVFQQGLLIPELTAVENVAVPLMLSGYPRREAESRAQHWLVALGLAGMEGRRIGELSGGQAQRVAIARAQVTGATVVFADEPTGALDSNTSVDVLNALLGSTVSQGHTLVVVTHDESVAARCSRVIRVRDGRIVSDSMNPHDHDGASAHPQREVQPMFYGDGWGVASAATLPYDDMPATEIHVPAGVPNPSRTPAPGYGQPQPTPYGSPQPHSSHPANQAPAQGAAGPWMPAPQHPRSAPQPPQQYAPRPPHYAQPPQPRYAHPQPQPQQSPYAPQQQSQQSPYAPQQQSPYAPQQPQRPAPSDGSER